MKCKKPCWPLKSCPINTNILIPKGQIIPALGLCPLVSMIPQSAEYYKIRYISLGLKGKNKSIDKEAIL